jgi:hypothetical protein
LQTAGLVAVVVTLRTGGKEYPVKVLMVPRACRFRLPTVKVVAAVVPEVTVLLGLAFLRERAVLVKRLLLPGIQSFMPVAVAAVLGVELLVLEVSVAAVPVRSTTSPTVGMGLTVWAVAVAAVGAPLP